MSSRSGLVESSATGASISSSMRRTYLIASAGSCAQERAPRVDFAPALDGLVDRLDLGLGFWRSAASDRALRRRGIADADLDLLEPVEHVELGQGDAVDAGDLDRLAHHHRVEPAAAALAPGDDAELLALCAQRLADLVCELGRERAAADARRIGLGDAEHVADRAGPIPEPDAAWPAIVLRRGDVGIGAVIDVEHDALRALEKDALAGLRASSSRATPARHKAAPWGRSRSALARASRLDLGRAEAAQQRVMVNEQRLDLVRRALAGSARSQTRMARRPTLSS